MTENLSEEREALYRMICSLKSEDVQKVVSYISFLRFVEANKDRDMKPEAIATESVMPEPAEPTGALSETRPAEPLPLENPEYEIFSLDEYVPELVQPEPEPTSQVTVYKNSGVADESLPQGPTRKRLKWVAKTLGLSFAEVAFLFHVSDLMVQAWFAGAPLGAGEEMQLHYILEATRRVKEMDIPRLDHVIRHPMPDGEFFLEKLKDRKITDDNLKMLRETAERCEELRHKFKGATKPFHDMQNAIGLYAVPLHCEG